jgi:hypothetical protein
MQDTNIQPDLSEGKDRGGIYLDDDKYEDDSRVIKSVTEPFDTNIQAREGTENNTDEIEEKSTEELPDR